MAGPLEQRVLLAVLVHYDFTGNTGIEAGEAADLVASQVTASSVSRGTGVSASGRTGWTDCLTSSNWTLNSSVENQDYYSFGVWTIAPGYAMSLDLLTFAGQSDSAGPSDYRLSFSSGGSAFGEVIAGSGLTGGVIENAVDLSSRGTRFRNLTGTVEFRLYGYKASSSTGKFRLLNSSTVGGLAVEGTITPVDTTPPTVAQAQFDFASAPQRVAVQFSEDVQGSLGVDDLLLLNVTGGSGVAAGVMAMAYDTATRTATWTFPGLADGLLSNGNYTATLGAAGITDLAGNALDGNGDLSGGDNYAMNFFQLQGDFDRNRIVDFDDLVIVAQNYEDATAMTWARGDINGDHKVSFDDLVYIAQNYQVKVLAAGGAAVLATPSVLVVSAEPVALAADTPTPAPQAAGSKRAAVRETASKPRTLPRPVSRPVFSMTPMRQSLAGDEQDVLGRSGAAGLAAGDRGVKAKSASAARIRR